MRVFQADLHMHTALSPCGDDRMTPGRIIEMAQVKNLGIIAVTDHNSSENVQAVIDRAQGTGITVIPGIEVQTAEEVHVVCLFPDIPSLKDFQNLIYDHLPARENRREFFGRQLILDSSDRIIGENPRLLLNSISLGVRETVEKAVEYGGIPIPAHIDRPAYSILSNLGFIPEGLNIAALEVSRNHTCSEIRERFRLNLPLIHSSDAHYPEDIGCVSTRLYLLKPVFSEIAMALASSKSRKVEAD